MQSARVRFDDSDGDVLGVIEIDAPLGVGGPETLWRTLFDLRLQIMSAQFRVAGDRMLHKLYVCELDGAPLEQGRASEIRTSVDSVLSRRGHVEWKGPRRVRPKR